MIHLKEIGLPLILAAGALVAAVLDAPNCGPHESGIVYLLLIPVIIALAALGIAALVKRRWLRLTALILTPAVCIACGEWLGRKQLCPECDREYFDIQENPDKG